MAARKAVELVTRRILRDALASAIVTIIVTAAFTGFATRSEPPVAAPAVALAVSAPQPAKAEPAASAAQDAMKVWLDPNTAAPNPKGFQRPASAVAARQASAPAPARKRVAAAKPAPSAPAPRPVASGHPLPLVAAVAHADEKVIGHRRTHDALASAAPEPEKRFRVWGVAPADLIPSVPSASSIVRGVKSVGSSVVSWMPSL